MNIDMNNLPEELTMNLVLVVSDFGWLKVFDASDKTLINSYVGLSIEPVSVTFKIGSKTDITNGLVENLKAESQKIRADAEVECREIGDKINSLLALTND